MVIPPRRNWPAVSSAPLTCWTGRCPHTWREEVFLSWPLGKLILLGLAQAGQKFVNLGPGRETGKADVRGAQQHASQQVRARRPCKGTEALIASNITATEWIGFGS